ncbi:hypothetical protein WCX18_03655 [Sulfurimonas sp. HSL1-2]|uniref:hypothetical protein n=1 Tax=Thiomicrolovo zhangzhouensis TaxID=3131933 RepID=UPI0031F877DA
MKTIKLISILLFALFTLSTLNGCSKDTMEEMQSLPEGLYIHTGGKYVPVENFKAGFEQSRIIDHSTTYQQYKNNKLPEITYLTTQSGDSVLTVLPELAKFKNVDGIVYNKSRYLMIGLSQVVPFDLKDKALAPNSAPLVEHQRGFLLESSDNKFVTLGKSEGGNTFELKNKTSPEEAPLKVPAGIYYVLGYMFEIIE